MNTYWIKVNNRNCGGSYKYILLAFMTLRHRPYNVYMALITVLGIPASIYVASIIILFFQHLDEPVSWPLISASMFLTMSLYSFHRSSIKSSEGMQHRHRLALKFQNSFKRFSVVTAIISCVCFVLLHPSYLIVPLLGFMELYNQCGCVASPLHCVVCSQTTCPRGGCAAPAAPHSW